MPGNRSGGLCPQRLARLSQAMSEHVARGDVSGVVTLVHRHGVDAHVDVIGWQDRDAEIALRRDTIFRIASMTKPIASVAALMLMEEGRLRLEDPLEQFLPEFANRTVLRNPAGPIDDTYAAPRSITILDLLTHRPGFANQFADTGPIAVEAAKLHVGNALLLSASGRDEWLARLAALPLAYAPGQYFNYGFATDVLGFVVGRIAGVPFEDFLQERLFGPLGMVDTAFHVPESKRSRFAAAYAPDPKTGKPVREDDPANSKWGTPPKAPSGSAGLVSTADDYLKFARMLMAGGKLDGRRYLSRKTIELMTTDFLTPAQRVTPFLGFDMWSSKGFGLGVSIVDRLGVQYGLGSPGTYGWGGAYGTAWSNDPKESMIAIMMIQLMVGPNSPKIGADFNNLVYQAIDD